MRILFVLTILLAAADLPHPSPIAIRHDVADSLYLELGAQYPSVVRVGAQGGNGTLIASDWVLTAAHVAEGMVRHSGGTFQVFVDGQNDGYAVTQVVLHPGFAPMGPNDIALLRLDRPVDGVAPVGRYRDRDEKGQRIVLVGHGDTKPGTGGEWVVGQLRRGATNVVDEANNAHLIFAFDAPPNATALEGTAGPGDSGGPAFIEQDGTPLVAGVSSLGQPGENGPGTYGAREHYVRVSSHAAWIDSVLSNPPSERLVNMPPSDLRTSTHRMGPSSAGTLPPGVVLLEEIGLLVAERNGRVQMVGRIDELYPDILLEGGIRPPAVLLKINDVTVESTSNLKTHFDALAPGTPFTLEFDHQGRTQRFELTK